MIQFGNDKIKEIYHGSDKIKEVYHGSDLVWRGGPPPMYLYNAGSNPANFYYIFNNTGYAVTLYPQLGIFKYIEPSAPGFCVLCTNNKINVDGFSKIKFITVNKYSTGGHASISAGLSESTNPFMGVISNENRDIIPGLDVFLYNGNYTYNAIDVSELSGDYYLKLYIEITTPGRYFYTLYFTHVWLE